MVALQNVVASLENVLGHRPAHVAKADKSYTKVDHDVPGAFHTIRMMRGASPRRLVMRRPASSCRDASRWRTIARLRRKSHCHPLCMGGLRHYFLGMTKRKPNTPRPPLR